MAQDIGKPSSAIAMGLNKAVLLANKEAPKEVVSSTKPSGHIETIVSKSVSDCGRSLETAVDQSNFVLVNKEVGTFIFEDKNQNWISRGAPKLVYKVDLIEKSGTTAINIESFERRVDYGFSFTVDTAYNKDFKHFCNFVTSAVGAVQFKSSDFAKIKRPVVRWFRMCIILLVLVVLYFLIYYITVQHA